MGIFNYRSFPAEKNTSDKVKSPCTNECELDQDGICIGCGRTLAEIAAWGEADDALRQGILEELRKRKRHAGKGK